MRSTIIKLFILLSVNIFVYSQGTELTIIHVNDTHSQLDAVGNRDASLNGQLGGLVKASSVIGTLKATEPNPIFLHGGDFSVGTFYFNKFFGVPELQILNSLGCDAMAVGNHEYDFGPQALADVLNTAFANGGFPLLSANSDVSNFPPMGDHIKPFVLKDINGVRVGIFGMTIPDPLSNPDPIVVSDSIEVITYRTVAELQTSGADVIIMISHLGSDIDQMLAAGIPGINVIIGAHEHRVLQQPVSIPNPAGFNTYICQAGSDYMYVGKLSLLYNNGNVSMQSYQLIPIDAATPETPDIKAVVDGLKQDIVTQYGNVFAQCGEISSDIERVPVGNPNYKDSPMGNYITDAYRFNTKTELGLSANGLISNKLYRGKLIQADLFRTAAYGFDETNGLNFKLVKFNIKGTELVKGLEYSLSFLGVSEDFLVQVSGMKFKYKASNPPGERVLIHSIRINEQMFNPARFYTATANEGMLGMLIQMGINVNDIEPTDVNEFTALCGFSANLNSYAISEGRIKETSTDAQEKNDVSASSENKYKLYDNYPNPFNPTTIITYEIPAESRVTVKIFNTLGQEVRELVNEVQKPGQYKAVFNAIGLSSGVYFYRIITNSFTETKTMILAK